MGQDTAANVSREDGALQLGRLGRAARDWVFGPSLLAVHVGVYLLVAVGLILRDLYRSPNDLRFEEPLTRWGIVVAAHAVLVGVLWTGWRAVREGRQPETSPATVLRQPSMPAAPDREANAAPRPTPPDDRVPAQPTGRFRPSAEATAAPDAAAPDVAAAEPNRVAAAARTTATAAARGARHALDAGSGLIGRLRARGPSTSSVTPAIPETPAQTDTMSAPAGVTPAPQRGWESSPATGPERPSTVPPTRLHDLSAAALHLDDPESPSDETGAGEPQRTLEAAVEFWMARPPVTSSTSPPEGESHPDGEPASSA